MAKRKALLVGINQYSIEAANLSGCINDIEDAHQTLTQVYHFNEGDIKILRNESATRQEILAALKNLVDGAQRGDSCFFHFSGHGTQVGNRLPSNSDEKTEAIVPYDISYKNLITNHEIFALLSQQVSLDEVNVTAVYDCCHSGAMIRALDVSATGEIRIVSNRFLPIQLPAVPSRELLVGPYTVCTACMDEETAADLDVSGVGPRGAFSFAFYGCLRDQPDVTPASIDASVLTRIKRVSSLKQTPVYYSVDLNQPLMRV